MIYTIFIYTFYSKGRCSANSPLQKHKIMRSKDWCPVLEVWHHQVVLEQLMVNFGAVSRFSSSNIKICLHMLLKNCHFQRAWYWQPVWKCYLWDINRIDILSWAVIGQIWGRFWITVGMWCSPTLKKISLLSF